jgi:hypothetical protein
MGRGIYVEPNSPTNVWADAIAHQLRASRPDRHLADSAEAVRSRYRPVAIAESVLNCVRAVS